VWLVALDRDGSERLAAARRVASGWLGAMVLLGAWAPFLVEGVVGAGPAPGPLPWLPFVPVAASVGMAWGVALALTRPWPWWTVPLGLGPWGLGLVVVGVSALAGGG